MRVLVVHNRYRSDVPGGENAVVDEGIGSLRNSGTEVVEFLESSDSIVTKVDQLRAATGRVWSQTGIRRFAEIVSTTNPDLVHVHNLNPLISPAVLLAAKRRGLPVVSTQHNHRLHCIRGTLRRDGRPGDDCLNTALPWPDVHHGCYRGSRLHSASMTAGQVAHRNTWRHVDRLLCLNAQQAQRLQRLGVRTAQVALKPNSVPDTGPSEPLGNDVLFLGRLDREKGVALLLDAWRTSGLRSVRRLVVVGAGPLKGLVRRAAEEDHSVVALGRLDAEGTAQALRRACLVVVPSVWKETFGRVAVEASAAGRPVVATRLGGLADLVAEGVGRLCDPTESLSEAMQSVLSDVPRLAAMARDARNHHLQNFHPRVVTEELIRHYAEVLGA